MYRRILFTPDDPAAGSGGGTPAAGDDEVGKQKGKDGPGGLGAPAPAGKTFTQEEVDAIVQRRLTRAESDWKAQAKADAEKAKLDEVERLKVEKQEADDRAAEAEKKAQQALVAAEVKVAILAAGAKPERIEKILRLVDLESIGVADNVPDAKAIEAAIALVKADLPELFGAGGTQRSGADFSGQGSGKRTYAESEYRKLVADAAYFDANKDELNAAVREGRVIFGK